MSPTRFLAIAILSFAVCAFTQTPASAVSSAAGATGNAAVDQLGITPYLHLDFDQPTQQADDEVKAESQPRKELPKLLDTERSGARFLPGTQLQNDATCFAIRSYRVVRDGPHSDSTHRDGYTTCVPAARFRVYTTDEHR
jgi:hypothetical protein